MSKAYIGAGIGIIIIAAGAYLALGRGGGAPAPEQSAATSTSSTLRELAASGSPQQCAFTSANNTKGTVYVAGGKVRGDFSAEVAGKAIAGHMIVADNTSYVWMDGMATGFKNSFEATAAASSTNSQGVNPDERVSYDCSAWSEDPNLFVLPTTVTFSAISDTSVKAGAGAVGASCGQCDLIPDANAKAQCKAALHC
jgi:hypothetical protein